MRQLSLTRDHKIEGSEMALLTNNSLLHITLSMCIVDVKLITGLILFTADVQGCSGRAGPGAEVSDYEREPAGGASWPEATHWPGGGRPAGQPPDVWLSSAAATQVSTVWGYTNHLAEMVVKSYIIDKKYLTGCSLSPSPSLRWMENVSLEVTANCGHPPELRGQSVRDVHVFTSCPESISPPGKNVVVALKPQKVKKPKPSLSKVPALKAKPVKPKAKLPKATKNRPPRKPVAPRVTKNKKTFS